MKAFPSKRPVVKHLGKFGPIDFEPIIEDGMELRDYFAVRAMQTFLHKNWEGLTVSNQEETDEIIWTVCTASYSVADHMMKAREQ